MNSTIDDPKKFLKDLFFTAVTQALPAHALKNSLPAPSNGRTIVIGAGKAAAAMAQAVDQLWPKDAELEGVVVTRYGHTPNISVRSRIEILEASHPVPDNAGVDASKKILNALSGLSSNDQVICLMSGGASSLLCLPIDEISLKVKQRINSDLLKSGARIDEMNCVRKHLSKVKGGRLAMACAPAKLITLAISDVPGDDMSVIGSGPTVADQSTCDDALRILKQYNIELPHDVHELLKRGEHETAKIGDDCFANTEVKLIATPWKSLRAAADFSNARGIPAYILSDAIEGESRQIGKLHSAIAVSIAKHDHPFKKPCLLLSGGETTVTLPKSENTKSRGGRAGEFCLGLAVGLDGADNVWALAADTDGIDGIESNAGAFVTPTTLSRANDLELDVSQFLSDFNSYSFFHELNDLLMTGPTFTNVNDFRAVLVL